MQGGSAEVLVWGTISKCGKDILCTTTQPTAATAAAAIAASFPAAYQLPSFQDAPTRYNLSDWPDNWFRATDKLRLKGDSSIIIARLPIQYLQELVPDAAECQMLQEYAEQQADLDLDLKVGLTAYFVATTGWHHHCE